MQLLSESSEMEVEEVLFTHSRNDATSTAQGRAFFLISNPEMVLGCGSLGGGMVNLVVLGAMSK